MWHAALKHNYRTLSIIKYFFKNSPRLFPLGATKLKTFSLNLSVRKKAACGPGLIPELPLFGRLRLKEPERRQTVKKPPEPGRR